MANITVDQAKLVLKSFSALFQNNLISSDLVTWRKHDGEMSDTNRLTVVEQVPPRYNVYQTVDGVRDLTAGVQDSVFGSEQYTLNRTFSSDMGYSDFQKIRDFNEARESEALKSAALNLAEKIDAYILGFAALTSNNWTGGTGTAAVDTFDDIASGYTRLKEEGNLDQDLRAVLTYGDKQALASHILYNGQPGTTGGAAGNAAFTTGEGYFRNGFEGRVAGIPTLFTQQLPTLTTGTRTNGTVTAAGGNVDYSTVAISAAPGQYLTQTLSLSGLGANATIADGEVFTIAGVNAYDNRLGAPIPRLQQFRVVGAATASAGGVATVRIFPAMIVPGSGTGSAIAVNTAQATVSAAPGAAAVVTWVGAPSTQIKPRFIMDKSAVIVNTKDLIIPFTGTAARQNLTKIPLSVRLWKDSTFATGEHRIRFDVALTANVAADGRRKITRISSV